ncbi:MAG: hypothetical protein COB29_10980 [Sulfitobacter sp.]|nr:MAG: hypothetical protein COB29_10980 [Sulfitobacter sp.]
MIEAISTKIRGINIALFSLFFASLVISTAISPRAVFATENYLRMIDSLFSMTQDQWKARIIKMSDRSKTISLAEYDDGSYGAEIILPTQTQDIHPVFERGSKFPRAIEIIQDYTPQVSSHLSKNYPEENIQQLRKKLSNKYSIDYSHIWSESGQLLMYIEISK